MVLTGVTAIAVAGLLLIWVLLLCVAAWKTYTSPPSGSRMRVLLSVSGLICSATAVSASLILVLSWLTADLSHKMSFNAVRIIASFLFWPSLVGLFCSTAGLGRTRFIGAATCIATGLWWFTLAMGSAISMGGMPVARHPVEYLIPQGYTGWIRVKRGENAPPLPLENGRYVCRIPIEGVVYTSTLIEEGWAQDRYIYYDATGDRKELPNTGWGKGGLIWGATTEFESPDSKKKPTKMTENIFVGTEEQYGQNTKTNGK